MQTCKEEKISLHLKKKIFDNTEIPNFINCDNEFKTHAEYCEKIIIKLYFSDPNDTNKNAKSERK